MKQLGKYSMGLGDRFGHQGDAQLRAVIEAGKKGIEITPVWNKSNREHNIIGTHPADVRHEADTVTVLTGFRKPYFVDADHINLENVDRFIESSDFFTIDVASYIGKRAEQKDISEFMSYAEAYCGKTKVQGMKTGLKCSVEKLQLITENYLFAAKKAGEIYRKIEKAKGSANFVTEVSMDEVAHPQTPVELFFILAMLGREKIPLQTIAPKFSGRFNKGVDYVGDPMRFAEEFEEDILVISFAAREFCLPENLKISIHSGSDKFAIYPHIARLLSKHNKGVHLKTAGTTWLEEVIGLAEAGGEALDFAKDIYVRSLDKIDELCAPYADVIDIDRSALPSAGTVSAWNRRKFADSLRHNQDNPDYNPGMRQLVHVAYKMAAEKMEVYSRLLNDHKKIISDCVYENIYNRHICRLFGINKEELVS